MKQNFAPNAELGEPPSVAIALCNTATIEWSPQPGHQRTYWSLLKSFAVYSFCSSISYSSKSFEKCAINSLTMNGCA